MGDSSSTDPRTTIRLVQPDEVRPWPTEEYHSKQVRSVTTRSGRASVRFAQNTRGPQGPFLFCCGECVSQSLTYCVTIWG